MWKREKRDGKITKIPYTISGAKAKADDSATWARFDQCLGAYENGNEYDGIGFVLTREVGVVGIDLDGCRDIKTGEISEEADHIVSQLRSYTEISPSKTGLHVGLRNTSRRAQAQRVSGGLRQRPIFDRDRQCPQRLQRYH